MAEEKKVEEDPIYTVIRNTTRNSKVVLSCLNGIEIAPGQTLDLRTMFRKAQLADAAHEIHSLIGTGHLEDMGEGATERKELNKSQAQKLQEDLKVRVRESLIREISGSSSLSQIEDFSKHKDPEVAKAAQIRYEILTGKRDDSGALLPGEEETGTQPAESAANLVG